MVACDYGYLRRYSHYHDGRLLRIRMRASHAFVCLLNESSTRAVSKVWSYRLYILYYDKGVSWAEKYHTLAK